MSDAGFKMVFTCALTMVVLVLHVNGWIRRPWLLTVAALWAGLGIGWLI